MLATVFAMRAVSKMAVQIKRSNAGKIKLFKSLFNGLDNAYGTYDIRSGQSRQVKAPVTDTVLKAHLMGRHLTPRKVPMPGKLYSILSNKYSKRDKGKPWIFWHRYP